MYTRYKNVCTTKRRVENEYWVFVSFRVYYRIFEDDGFAIHNAKYENGRTFEFSRNETLWKAFQTLRGIE